MNLALHRPLTPSSLFTIAFFDSYSDDFVRYLSLPSLLNRIKHLISVEGFDTLGMLFNSNVIELNTGYLIFPACSYSCAHSYPEDDNVVISYYGMEDVTYVVSSAYEASMLTGISVGEIKLKLALEQEEIEDFFNEDIWFHSTHCYREIRRTNNRKYGVEENAQAYTQKQWLETVYQSIDQLTR